MKLRYKALLTALVLAAVAAAGAGVARSTSTEPIPDAQGVIHACYKKPIGEVKIVYSAANCGPGQLPIQWSQAGPQGPKGEPGPQGQTGPQGPPGSPGGGGGVQLFESIELGIAAVPLQPGGVLSLTLGEPGTYWITAKGVLLSAVGPNGQAPTGTCELEIAGSNLDQVTESFTGGGAKRFTLSDVAAVAQPGEVVDIVCSKFSLHFPADSVPMSVGQLRIVALKVA